MAGFLLSIAGSCALFQSAQAQFTNKTDDLMLVFRKITKGDLGSVDFEVDIGQASKYYGAAQGVTIPITAYTTTQLGAVFPDAIYGTGYLTWSVSGCVPETGDNGASGKPSRTLWLTDPRPDPGTPPAVIWSRASIYQQGPTALGITTILDNALAWGGSVPSDSVTNTPTAVAITTGTAYCADGTLTAVGNFGTFQGDVENTTPELFPDFGTPSRSDFYELQPGSGHGTYLGYFQLGTDGSMTFNTLQTYSPPNLSISADGAGNVDISFLSAMGGTYTLYYTGDTGLATPVSTWSTAGSTITGDGTVKTFVQAIGGTDTYYSVSVH